MSRSETRRVVLADAALQLEALEEQVGRSTLPEPLGLVTPAAGAASVMNLAHDAVAEVLGEMGLTVQRDTDSTGRTVFTGREQDRVATVTVGEDGSVDVVTADLSDIVHSLHEQAREICPTAVQDSLEFHTLLTERALRRGLRYGQIEALGLPTRGGGGSTAIAVPPSAAVRQAGR